MNITQEQFQAIEWALRIAEFWLDDQEPYSENDPYGEQIESDRNDLKIAYAALKQIKDEVNQ